MAAVNPWLALPSGAPSPVLTRGLRAAHEALVTRADAPPGVEIGLYIGVRNDTGGPLGAAFCAVQFYDAEGRPIPEESDECRVMWGSEDDARRLAPGAGG